MEYNHLPWILCSTTENDIDKKNYTQFFHIALKQKNIFNDFFYIFYKKIFLSFESTIFQAWKANLSTVNKVVSQDIDIKRNKI